VARKALVVCPGRGTYNSGELGYLRRYHAPRGALLAMADARRAAAGETPVTVLDAAESYSAALHARGDNASPLIFTCSYADFLALDRDAIEVVAVTGNSMGWYTALACGGALGPEHAFDLVNEMGGRMHHDGVGGQLIHMTLDEEWRPIAGRREALLALAGDIPDLHVSIELGGMIVFAGAERALDMFLERAPAGPGSFPLRLRHHAAFHTPLLAPVSAAARASIPASRFRAPAIPMIDGRGHVWKPFSTDPAALWDYTLGHQVVRTYDFTRAIAVGVREYAPDCVIVLGPGTTLGGAVIQSLVAMNWRGWESKSAFQTANASAPYVVSLGNPAARPGVAS